MLKQHGRLDDSCGKVGIVVTETHRGPVGVWQRFNEVSDIVSGEATAMASLWRDIDGYPQPLRETTESILRSYTEQ